MGRSGEVYVPPSPRRDEIVEFVRANPGCSPYRAVKETGRSRVEDSAGYRAVKRAVELGLLVEADAKDRQGSRLHLPA